jgi:hypothetical protein
MSSLVIRQSDLSSYARCPQQKKLSNLQRDGLLPKAPEQLSATAFGSVIHSAVHIMERRYALKDTDPLGHARTHFEYYWNQENIEAICPRVTIWLPRETWSGMLARGLATLDLYWEHLQQDKGRVLGLEVSFNVPIVIDGTEHTLHGTIDRLALRRTGRAFLSVEDFKSGRDYYGLRFNQQFSVYSYASLQPEFWAAWEDGEALYERFRDLPRRGTWISLRDGVKRSDAGWRGPQDYARLEVALREYVRAVKADIYPLNLSGSVCTYCPYREGLCGGVALPDERHGS